MVSAEDLLRLARELSLRPEEVAQRASVSRAYYAAYLHCRAGLADRGLELRRQASDHSAVQSGLRAINLRAGEILEQLRLDRNVADYDVHLDFPGGRSELACAAVDELRALL